MEPRVQPFPKTSHPMSGAHAGRADDVAPKLLASGLNQLDLILQGISGATGPAQRASLFAIHIHLMAHLVQERNSAAATKSLANISQQFRIDTSKGLDVGETLKVAVKHFSDNITKPAGSKEYESALSLGTQVTALCRKTLKRYETNPASTLSDGKPTMDADMWGYISAGQKLLASCGGSCSAGGCGNYSEEGDKPVFKSPCSRSMRDVIGGTLTDGALDSSIRRSTKAHAVHAKLAAQQARTLDW